ncbi:hypothetical protein [Spirillospora sp. CA-294931]|uniref:hypothetical protein n=1 Tax=Spirillospora sp. CA-294931 TaxID=3240042 RepID=UPI003D8EAC52
MTILASPAASGAPEDPSRLTCFAIGPIGDMNASLGSPERRTYEDSLEIYTQVTLAACRACDIASVRSDELPDLGEITEQVRRYLSEADLVIADVSGANANVMYELGMRHATGRPTILLGERGQLPFNIAAVRTIQFEREPNGLISARKVLERTLKAVLQEGLDVLTPTRIIRPEDSDQTQEVEDQPGLLENYALIESGLEELTDDFDTLTKSIEQISVIMEAATSEILRLNGENVPASARVSHVARLAKELADPADCMEATSTQLSERMQTVDSAIRGILDFTSTVDPADQPEGTAEFLEILVGFAATATENLRAVEEFAVIVDSARKFSRVLRKPLTQISTSGRRVAAVSISIAEWGEIAEVLLRREPGD